MKIHKIVLFITTKLRPIIIKIIPIKLLRKGKRKFLSSAVNDLKESSTHSYELDKNKDGINLIGDIRSDIGLGQSCRLVASELEYCDFDFIIYNYQTLPVEYTYVEHIWDKRMKDVLSYNINLIHLNPLDLETAYVQLSKETWKERYNIAFWLWELEEFPDEWTRCFPLLNEIWTPSEFISKGIARKTDIPIYTIPYCIAAPTQGKYNREHFDLPEDKFLFLIMYDSNSTIERKNPVGAIEAFKCAFSSKDSNAALVIKINNAKKEDIKILKRSLEDFQNIYFITDTLEKVQVNSLIKCVDVFVSLHRAEGFGLVLAESMLLGTPTIATNWSSNIEFMNSHVACMVDYELVVIQKDSGAYKRGYRWAQPDVECASMFMKKLYSDREFYLEISNNAKLYIQEKLSMEAAVKKINNRIHSIYIDNKHYGDKVNLK